VGPLLSALICLRCASADCACGRLAGFAAEAALAEAAADAAIVGSGDPEQDDAAIIELTSLLLARRCEAEKPGDAP
jgi:hypothetical protein